MGAAYISPGTAAGTGTVAAVGDMTLAPQLPQNASLVSSSLEQLVQVMYLGYKIYEDASGLFAAESAVQITFGIRPSAFAAEFIGPNCAKPLLLIQTTCMLEVSEWT